MDDKWYTKICKEEKQALQNLKNPSPKNDKVYIRNTETN
jgi:hypothetical protein